MAETVTLHCRVEGLVQGVFFRASTRRRALELGLKGWVRNMNDGSVEALFHGERHLCDAALAWIRKGPPGANVTAVEETWRDDAGAIGNVFEIR